VLSLLQATIFVTITSHHY